MSNFVPTSLLTGRIDSNGVEVYPPIVSIASGKLIIRGVHPPASRAGNKITSVRGFFIATLPPE